MLDYFNQRTLLFIVMLYFFNCISKNHNTNTTNKADFTKSNTGFTKLNIEKYAINTIDMNAGKILEDWTAFYILKNEIKKLESGVSGIFDMGEKDIQEMFSKLKSDTPPVLDNNKIWSRLKVLETHSYKYYHASLERDVDSLQLDKQIHRTLTAYNNLVRQINKTHERDTQFTINTP